MNASRILEDRNGEYLYQSSKTTNKAFYVRLGGSTNSSIAFGDVYKGWRVCLQPLLIIKFKSNIIFDFSLINRINFIYILAFQWNRKKS